MENDLAVLIKAILAFFQLVYDVVYNIMIIILIWHSIRWLRRH